MCEFSLKKEKPVSSYVEGENSRMFNEGEEGR
jgi:hypothetical protein